MRKFVTVASIVVLAASVASCGSSPQGSNSAGNILPLDNPIGPSSLEARSPSGGGGKGGGKGSGGSGGGTTTDGGGDGSSSLSVAMVTDLLTPGVSWSDTITFNVSTSAARPFVRLHCSQGSLVYSAMAGFFADYSFTKNFILRSDAWRGGAATCTARLYTSDGTTETTLATLSFNAAA